MAVASSNIVLKSLSILLGLFFIFVGIMKIGPYLSKELHRDLVIILRVNFKPTRITGVVGVAVHQLIYEIAQGLCPRRMQCGIRVSFISSPASSSVAGEGMTVLCESASTLM